MSVMVPETESIAALEPATYNAFVAGLQLEEVQVVRLLAEHAQPGVATTSRFEMQVGYQRSAPQSIHYRYDVNAYIDDDNGIVLGRIEAAVVVGTLSNTPPDDRCVEMFGATSGAMIAHPFLREVIASTALRIGFSGVLLPLMTTAQVVEAPKPPSPDEGALPGIASDG